MDVKVRFQGIFFAFAVVLLYLTKISNIVVVIGCFCQNFPILLKHLTLPCASEYNICITKCYQALSKWGSILWDQQKNKQKEKMLLPFLLC